METLRTQPDSESAWTLFCHSRLQEEMRAHRAWGLLARGEEATPEAGDSQNEMAWREELVRQLEDEMRAQSAWTLLCHDTIAGRLGLNPTDHKCLDIIVRAEKLREPVTPGQLARETQLTTGAVTGILDRLEHAGFVKRQHDPEDRRRVILIPDMERIHADVMPKFEVMSQRFQELCCRYSDEELRLLIDFSQQAQLLLRSCMEQLKLVAPSPQVTV